MGIKCTGMDQLLNKFQELEKKAQRGIADKALNKAGYSNQLIHRADNGHYWNLVNVGGAWRHIDATPSPRHTLGLLTDDQKWNDAGLDGVGWDKSKWPAAE